MPNIETLGRAVIACAVGLASALPTAACTKSINVLPRALIVDQKVIRRVPDPRLDDLPALTLTGAWRLRSRDRKFGGISGIIAAGNKLTLLSDAGVIVELQKPSREVHPAGIVATLPGYCATTSNGRAPDSEAIALSPDGLGLRIALETANMICIAERERPSNAKLFDLPSISRWPRNQGAEAMATSPSGAMVIIGGAKVGDNSERTLIWFGGDLASLQSHVTTMRYKTPRGFNPSDAAFLPDGRLLVLNRRYSPISGYRAIVTISEPVLPAEGKFVLSTTLLNISNRRITGNYEAMAVDQSDGRISLWLASDNNFFPGRATKLLRFDVNTVPDP